MNITAAEVGTMSDQELAAMLNERWSMICHLLRKAGGSVTFTEREIVEARLGDMVEQMKDPVAGTVTLRLIALLAHSDAPSTAQQRTDGEAGPSA